MVGMTETGIQPPSAELAGIVAALFTRPVDEGVSLALVVLQDGEISIERYGERPGDLFHPEPRPVDAHTPLDASTATRSVVHAAVGVLVGDGRLDLAAPAPAVGPAGRDDESLTLLDLLETGRELVGDPSPATTDCVTAAIADVVGGAEQGMREFLDERLFGPAGMPSADPCFGAAGNWIASSLFATSRDFARFGELYLRDGMVGGDRVLPEGWADHARTVVEVDAETGLGRGRHWWTWPDQPQSLAAHGQSGQCILVLPERDAVVVHLGESDAAARWHVIDPLRALINCL